MISKARRATTVPQTVAAADQARSGLVVEHLETRGVVVDADARVR